MPSATRPLPQPAYDLTVIHALMRRRAYRVTDEAASGVRAAGLSARDVEPCVLSLDGRHEREGGHFYKTMPATNAVAAERGLYHDVYRVRFKGVLLYVKLQVDASKAVVIQMKRK